MKLAISARSPIPETAMEFRFNKSTYFFIFDIETGSYTTIKNTAARYFIGISHGTAKILNQNGVQAVISGNYDPRSVAALQSFGIKMYLSTEENIWMVFDKFKNNLLLEVNKSLVRA